mmetsp:Transcript_20085/g.46984  ORF Transcript_20085/g.46984 Transcript_20085/m.46984 type:complete len:91 (-) Transcript_20085:272-544(-)
MKFVIALSQRSKTGSLFIQESEVQNASVTGPARLAGRRRRKDEKALSAKPGATEMSARHDIALPKKISTSETLDRYGIRYCTVSSTKVQR